ncbi:MAG TPA: hypothetical protein P5079_09415, partial [Elusimicrobiota bacterium]|nr:hypothetical protein [Elusimicrobiota bacterium]
GITTADGSNPPHLDAWCKKFLGFASVQSLSGTVSHSPSETTRTGVNQLAIPVGGTSEYFLVEYRLRSSAGSYDKGLPMDGLAVWHIDDAIALNTTQLANNTVNSPSQNGFNHLGIDLVEADGTAANPQNSDLGIGDAYADGQTFAAPYSNSFSGQPSGVTIANIAGVGTASVNSSVAFIQATTALTVAKTVNYPNPAGDTKKYPVRAGAPAGTITTFVAQFSRPVESSELQLDIYNLRGDRIKGISGPEITLKIGAGEPSSDYKWVYEYDWNGKNDSGDEIVSGVYLYRFKAQEEVKTGKVMIVR